MRRIRCGAFAAMIVWASASSVSAYFLLLDKWPDGAIVVNPELGPAPHLTDGFGDWDDSAAGALATWNQSIRRVQFNAVRHSSAAKGDGDGINAVFFASDVYGMSFNADVVAATTNWVRGTTRVEADVVFNSALPWDSYGGRLRGGTADFHRVALHEFGHVLGLDHPDEYGQAVRAVMNSQMSDLDVLTGDDIAGAQALYGVSGAPGAGGGFGTGTVMFPPRNESFDFRNALEAKYRDGLQRSPAFTSLDIEGDIVWTQEYLRYRVNRCPHDDAIGRVMVQIDGLPAPPVCGASPVGQVLFPPRNEPYELRTLLERKYHESLGRAATIPSTVDIEGDVVWTQEYLRYRVNGCGHGVAVASVLVQIDGRPAPPVCR